MVTFTSEGKMLVKTVSNLMNTRTHKRIPLVITLFLCGLDNHISYSKMVETINVSDRGLLISCDVALRQGMQLEITSASRRVKVIAEVKHISYEQGVDKWLIGLAIREKKTDWVISEPTNKPLTNISLIKREYVAC